MRWPFIVMALSAWPLPLLAADAPAKPHVVVAAPTADNAMTFQAPTLGADTGTSPEDVGAPQGQKMISPAVGAPAPVVGPASLHAPAITDGTGPVDQFKVDPQAVSPALPTTLPAPMVAPAVTTPPEVTVPPLEPMSAGAPRFTTPEDVVRSVAKMKHDRDARLHGPARAQQGQHGNSASSGNTEASSQTGGIPTGGINGAASVPPLPSQAASIQAAPLSGYAPDASACGSGGDITQLLSAACLNSLRYIAPRGTGTATPPAAAAPTATQCTMVMFGTTGAASPVSFQAAGVEQCLAVATRMSYGVPGLSNITAVDPVSGIVAVTCRRAPPEATTIECEAQQ
jgi:hypothetical protein